MPDYPNFADHNIYSSPAVTCPLCGSSDLREHFLIKRFYPVFRTDRCNDCGFIFMNPAFNDKVADELYSKDYYTGRAEYNYYDERDAERYSAYVWRKRIKKIRRYVDSGNFLDIGCAFGGLLKTASKYFNPFGMDVSQYSGSHAKKLFGDNIHIGTLEDHPFEQDFFSVITMIELIEHTRDSVSAVRECYRLLKKGGLLVIQTANMDGMQARVLKERYGYYLPGHFSYFSKKNIIIMLRKAGFGRIRVFYPVEFGLLPKLMKSRYNFKTYLDYRKWLRIAYYHYISKIRFGNFAVTSSMVVYAFK